MALSGVTQRQDRDLSLHAARARRVEGYLVLPLAIALEKAMSIPFSPFSTFKEEFQATNQRDQAEI